MLTEKFLVSPVCAVRLLAVCAIAMLCAISAPFAFAQYQDPQTSAEITVYPPYPGPNQNVEAEFTTYSINTAGSLVTWTLNGKVIKQAYGDTRVTFKTGALGSNMVLSVSAKDTRGKTVGQVKRIDVNDVTLVWEGRTYTPPLYRGRALWSPGSAIVVYAQPSIANGNGGFYDPGTLTYRWTLNGNVTPVAEVYGKPYATLMNDTMFEDFEVTLTIRDPKGNIRIIKSIEIPQTQPALFLYRTDPLLGIMHNTAIPSAYHMSGSEETLVAEPYYYSVSKRTDQSLAYEWQIGNQTLSLPGSITLRPEGAGQGSTPLSLAVNNNGVWQQNARASTVVFFDTVGAGATSESTTPL